MVDLETLERIVVRRAELDGLEARLVKQLKGYGPSGANSPSQYGSLNGPVSRSPRNVLWSRRNLRK
ncbi:hypothetical protein [Streptomyces sp. NPDC088794]|uniref:hypothetical protein n=1 Tax=Streptomyces sp. NPDC088794 TaxID=3365902 RepID=UPI0037F5941C